MSKLLDRLRFAARWPEDDGFDHGILADEAADELERLRARLEAAEKLIADACPEEIEKWCDECGGCDEQDCPETCYVRRAHAYLGISHFGVKGKVEHVD